MKCKERFCYEKYVGRGVVYKPGVDGMDDVEVRMTVAGVEPATLCSGDTHSIH